MTCEYGEMKSFHAAHSVDEGKGLDQFHIAAHVSRWWRAALRIVGKILGKLAIFALFGYIAAFWWGIATLIRSLIRPLLGD